MENEVKYHREELEGFSKMVLVYHILYLYQYIDRLKATLTNRIAFKSN